MIVNVSAGDVYFGPDADVTTDSGIPVVADGTLGLELPPGRQVWAIVASGTAEVRVVSF